MKKDGDDEPVINKRRKMKNKTKHQNSKINNIMYK